MVSEKLKGGVENMEQTQDVVHTERCPYCNKEFKALNKAQLESWINTHKLFCKSGTESTKKANEKP